MAHKKSTYIGCEQRPLFSQLFLCLSRACLGKMIVYMYKLLKKGGFRRTALTDLCFLEAGGGEVRKTPSFEPFYTENDQFTKTGSGQTWGKHSKKR